MLPPARVLVVEDTEMVRHLFGRLLRAEGYEPLLVESAEAALAELREQKFDLLVTDQTLPGAGGLELIQEARRLHYFMPSILVTGNVSEEMTRRARLAGAAACLFKPFRVAELREVCARWTGMPAPRSNLMTG